MKRMKYRIMIILLSAVSAQVFAQLTLSRCHEQARSRYPLIKQYELVRQSMAYTVSNASKAYLPEMRVGLGALGFTDAVSSLTKTIGTSLFDEKNYLLGGSVQVNQLVYDGGAVAAQKRLAVAQAEAEERRLDVHMYEVNARVDELYFSVLMLDEQLRQIKLLQSDLELSRKTVEALMNGGLANASDADAVAVEQVRAEQQESSLRASRRAYAQMLSLFVGQDVDEDTHLARPAMVSPAGGDGTLRPEMSYFAARQRLLDMQRRVLDSRLMPTVSAFAVGMYHNKVIDLMKPAMLAGGVMLSWKISPFYTRKNDLRNLETQKQMIAQERETFLFNTALQNKQAGGAVSDLQEQIKRDDRIIRLRQSIYDKAVAKVQNGIETVNEMLREVNAVNEARQQKSIHEIRLLQEIYKLKNINNN